MKNEGFGLGAIGLLATIIGLFVNVGRRVGYGVGEVANLHAMHVQSLLIIGGLIVFLSGVVLFAAGAITETIREKSGGQKSQVTAEISDSGEAPSGRLFGRISKLDFIMGGIMIVALVGLVLFLSQSRRSDGPGYQGEPGALNRALDNGTDPLAPMDNSMLLPGNAM